MAWTYEYPRPALTADCVLFGHTESDLQLLLIERSQDPFSGHWALPGGFVDMEETADQAAHRELQEETGISGVSLTQLGTWSGVDRDPRGRVVSVAYWGLVAAATYEPTADDDAAVAEWHPVNRLPPLAFDHADIVDAALVRLRTVVHLSPESLALPATIRQQLRR